MTNGDASPHSQDHHVPPCAPLMEIQKHVAGGDGRNDERWKAQFAHNKRIEIEVCKLRANLFLVALFALAGSTVGSLIPPLFEAITKVKP